MVAMLLFAISIGAHAATANVTLAWNTNTETNLVGYRLYYGTAAGVYSGSVLAGVPVTTATVSNLQAGQTYYFAVKATNYAGLESSYSSEVVYAVPQVTSPPATMQIRVASNRQAILTLLGVAGHTYEIHATSNFTAWTVIGNVTIGAGGSLNFTDTNAPNFPRQYYRAHATQP